ncbi:hypothetical protein LB517_28295 [Mesorhizobium sp. BR1-1-12]|uniref:hypothetical protein n=1 Tax=Mesorhizobium sp. BR1-1-12 TaxID=2876657 RepID=UPI001CD0B4FD|nr:hypothetical protein [Mesorhizobium sp. BR1-1-12]MBZ9973535.1 hypothetical protein [Mesorhizobium sp. BR1-1-12]
MTSKNDGGAAFPVSGTYGPVNGGMTLRDWFAGQALTRLATMNASWPVGVVAEYCYRFADAMIEARSK